MDEVNVTVLVDAKEEYTKQLISILKNLKLQILHYLLFLWKFKVNYYNMLQV